MENKVELLLLHKSNIFAAPVWYDGTVHESSSLSVGSYPRGGLGKIEQRYNLVNRENGGELIGSNDTFRDHFIIIRSRVNGNELKKDSHLLITNSIEKLKAYRSDLILSLVNGCSKSDIDETEQDRLASHAFRTASAICTQLFNEEFNIK